MATEYIPGGTTIPTFLLDRIIAEGNGTQTISQLRAGQLAALPYDCPQCDDTSGLVNIAGQQVMDPLCVGMGRLNATYTKVCDASHWQLVAGTPPAPPPSV